MTVVERLRNRGVTPRAVLYARFSSDNQREESIEAQLRAMHEYCSRNSIVIIHEYCDRAKSATTDDRPEFLKMIAASREGNFDFAIVHKLDRFSRNRYDSAYYKRELKKNGVQLLSVLEQMDDSPESIILESVLEGMSEYYSKNLAREVMKGMRESAMDCRYIGGWIPYGFRVDPQTHRYIINDYEAEAVRMIFRDVADGCGYNVVLNKLNSMGYRTRLGNTFSKETLYEMLRNEKYNGVYVFSRAASKDELGRRNNHMDKPIEDQIRIPGGMPKIVDDETFARVQAILASRKRHRRQKSKRNYVLTGLVFCGLCGHRYCGDSMQTGKDRKVVGTYACNNRNNHGARICRNQNVRQQPLEELVLRKIEEIVFDESRIPGIVQAYRELCQQEDGTDKDKIRTLRQNLKTVEQKINNIVNIIANTGSAALVTQLTQLEREKELLDVQIQEEERGTKEDDLDEEAIRAAFRQAQKMFHSGTLPQMEQIINLYLDRVVVFPDYVEIHLNNVPTNLLNPSEAKDEPALGGLHTFYIEKMSDNILPKYQTGKIGQYGYDILVKVHRKEEKKNKSRRKGHNETQAKIGLGLGESGGAEGNRTPVRKQLGKNFSGRSLLFAFPFPGGNKHPTRIGSFIMRGMGKAYHTHVLRLNHTRARVSGTPGADGRLIRQPGQQYCCQLNLRNCPFYRGQAPRPAIPASLPPSKPVRPHGKLQNTIGILQPTADLESSVRIGELVRLRVGLAVGVHGDGGDLLLRLGTVIAVGLDGGDGVHHVHTGGYLAEGGILTVQMLGVGVHDEELAARGVGGGGTRHAENAPLVLQIVLDTVEKELTLNAVAGAAHAGALGAAALNHEAGNDSVEDQTIIKMVIAQVDEVADALGRLVGIQLALNDAAVFHGDLKCGIH